MTPERQSSVNVYATLVMGQREIGEGEGVAGGGGTLDAGRVEQIGEMQTK